MLKRIITAVALIAVLAAALYFSGLVCGLLLTLCAVLSVFELTKLFAAKGEQVFAYGAVIFAALFYVLHHYLGLLPAVALLLLCVVATIAERIFNKSRTTNALIYSLLIFIYPILFYVILMLIADSQNMGLASVALLCCFAMPLLGDTLAYFGGKLFGKRKLCPDISPNKTVAGGIGGLLGGLLAGLVMFYAQRLWGQSLPVLPLLLTGLACGALGQIGDLCASLLKRWAGVKDYGSIFPGHGGMMDRLDSVLMCAPLIWAVFKLMFGI